MVYGCVRLKIPDIFEIEALAEKVFADGLRPVDLAGYFFLIVTSGIEAGVRIQTAKIGLSADVVPVRMCDEGLGELRESTRLIVRLVALPPHVFEAQHCIGIRYGCIFAE